MIKKIFYFSTFFTFALSCLALFIVVTFIASGIPHNYLKKKVVDEMQNVFAYPVSFGEVRGNLLTRVIVDDIIIENDRLKGTSELLLHAKSAVFDYNLINLFLGDKLFLKKKIKILIDNPEINIEHYRDDTYNILSMLALPEGEGGGQFPYQLNIGLNNSSITYLDERGFGPEPLKKAVLNKSKNVNASVILRGNKLLFDLNGKVKDVMDYRPMRLKGRINLDKGKFKINLKAEKVDFFKWGNYTFSMPGFLFLGGDADVDITLTERKTPPKKYDLPFMAKVVVDANNVSMRIPWIRPELKHTQGRMILTNNSITFMDVNGLSGGNPYSFVGTLNDFAKLKVDLDIKSKHFDCSEADRFFPFLKGWALKGVGSLGMKVSSKPGKNPVITGDFFLNKGEVYSHTLDKVTSRFRLKDGYLSLFVDKSRFYDGKMIMNGLVDLNKKNPQINVTGNISSIDVKKVFRDSKYFDGLADVRFVVNGIADQLDIDTVINPINTDILWQPISQCVIKSTRYPEFIDFYDVHLQTSKGDVVTGNARLYPDRKFSSELFLEYVSFNNAKIHNDYWRNVAGDLVGNVSVSGMWNDYITKDPLRYISLTANARIDNLEINDQKLSQVSSNIYIRDRILQFEDLSVYTSMGNVVCSLSMDKKGLRTLKAAGDNVEIEKFESFKKYIPKVLHTIKGFANFKLEGTLVSNQRRSGKTVLQQLSLQGDVLIKKGHFYDQPVDNFAFAYTWDGDKLVFKDVILREGISSLTGTGYLSFDKKFEFYFDSPRVLFEDFRILSHRLGRLGGDGSVKGKVTGVLPSWNIDVDVDLEAVRYNSVFVDHLLGHISKLNKQIELNGVAVTNKNDVYHLDGFFNYERDLKYNMLFDTQSADLAGILDIIESIRLEKKKRESGLEVSDSADLESEDLNKFLRVRQDLSEEDSLLLYSNSQARDTVLDEFIRKRIDILAKTSKDEGLVSLMGGRVSGKARIDNTSGYVNIGGDVEVLNGFVSHISFDRLRTRLETDLKDRKIEVLLRKGSIAGSEFDSIDGDFLFDENHILTIKKFNMGVLGGIPGNIATGTIPLGELLGTKSNGEMNVDVNLKGDHINLLSIFNKNVVWMKNQGNVSVHIGGSVGKPIINSKEIKLVDASIKLSKELYLTSPLKITDARVSIVNNKIFIDDIYLLWKGEDTFDKTNRIRGEGSLLISKMTFIKPDEIVLDFDLKINDTLLRINFPQLYMGEMRLKNASFKGPFIIPFSEKSKRDQVERIYTEAEIGPILRSDIEIFEGEVPLPEKKPRILKPSIIFDVRATIGKNVIVAGGNFSKGTFAELVNDLDVEIKESTIPLVILGSLNTMEINGKLYFDVGELSVLNRGFDILSEDDQEDYFKKDGASIQENTVEFMLEFDELENRRRLNPYFNLAAITEINVGTENINAATAGSGVGTKYTGMANFIFVISGAINDPMSMYVYQYNETSSEYELRSGHPVILGKMTYEEVQELSNYLLPEILKPELYEELFTEGLEGERTREFLKKISEKQINTMFARQLRPVERNIARRVGAYDIRFDYNLGKTINKAIFEEEQQVDEDEQADEKIIGMDIAYKLFLDRLYVKVKTQLDQEQQGNNVKLSLSEYQLSYALLQWLTLNYRNRLYEKNYKLREVVSLEALYSF